MKTFLIGVAALAISAAAHAAPSDDLKQVSADHWAWSLSVDPLLASDTGSHVGDGKLPDPSLAEADREAAAEAGFIKRLDAIDPARLDDAGRVNRAVLRRMLADDVEANKFGQRAVTFTTYSSWHTEFPQGLPDRPMRTVADYQSYLARLAGFPAYNAAAINVTRTGLIAGMAQPCAPFEGYETSITTHIVTKPEDSAFWAPFAKPRPVFVPAADWAAMQARARALIMDGIVPAYRDLLGFYTKAYRPKCRAVAGISATPNGAAYYAFRARRMTTTDLTPAQIHQIGLDEVARIGAAMDKVATDAGYKDRATLVAHMRTDPQFYARTPQELLEKAAYMNKLIDDWLPRIIGKLPRLTFTVKPIPADQAEATTTAYSGPGSAATGRAGAYWINTSHLDQRPLYELPALTLHEAAPGHQTQMSLQQELPLPDFRRHQASFTAFVEGWALYTESLGDEMGLYDTPEKKMGRYSYEMWRACRLVVDTGIHSMGWSREQAIDYMLKNTALSRHNVEAEVNRYISWPGQALAYKIGELTIRKLRASAEVALGPKFDERAFHDAVLANGAVPLDVLTSEIDRWIAAQNP
jgi:uncharacterized protein (DUF885 family)